MSKDIQIPDDRPRWATELEIDPVTGIANVVAPPESKRNAGWNRGEKPPRNFVNFLHLYAYRWLEFFEDRVVSRNPVTNGAGAQIFCKDDVLITLDAVDKTNPLNYIKATGYRTAASIPVLNVVSSNVLTLGVGLADGTQPILGGNVDDIVIYGQMQK